MRKVILDYNIKITIDQLEEFANHYGCESKGYINYKKLFDICGRDDSVKRSFNDNSF